MLYTRIMFAFALAIGISGHAAAQSDSMKAKPGGDDAVLVLTDAAIARINKQLARERFTIVFPTGVDAAPTGCPSGGTHCIWMCTGNDPLDDIDADTCSTDTYKCNGCGSDGGDVCQDSAGNPVTC